MSGTAHIKEIKKGYIKAIASTNNLGTLKPLRLIKRKLKRKKKKKSVLRSVIWKHTILELLCEKNSDKAVYWEIRYSPGVTNLHWPVLLGQVTCCRLHQSWASRMSFLGWFSIRFYFIMGYVIIKFQSWEGGGIKGNSIQNFQLSRWETDQVTEESQKI